VLGVPADYDVVGSAKGSYNRPLIALAKIASPGNRSFDLFSSSSFTDREDERRNARDPSQSAGNPSARSWEFPMQLLGKIQF
jgi:hypothetical protein